VALITAAVVVFVGVEQSILLAIVLSLVVHTRHGYLMRNKLLVLDQAQGWGSQEVATAQQTMPGLMIYRFMHSMYYANAQVLTREVADLVAGAEPPVSWFCIDMAAVDDVDFSAAAALRKVHGIVKEKGARLVLCEVVDDVREEFDRSGLTELFGKDSFFTGPLSVLRAFSGKAPIPIESCEQR
jgi:MFS superfamily sulfate permease-like transporter